MSTVWPLCMREFSAHKVGALFASLYKTGNTENQKLKIRNKTQACKYWAIDTTYVTISVFLLFFIVSMQYGIKSLNKESPTMKSELLNAASALPLIFFVLTSIYLKVSYVTYLHEQNRFL